MTIHEVVTVLCKSGCKRGLFRDMTSNIVSEAENLVIWNWLTVKTETGRLERNKCQDNSSLLVNKENMQHWARTRKLFSFGKLEIICSSKLTIFLKLHSNYLYNLWAYFAKNGSYCCTFMFQIFLGMLAKSIQNNRASNHVPLDTLDPSDWTKILNSLDNLNYIIACTQGLPISQGPTAVKKSLCTVRPCIHHMTSIAARFQNFRDFFPLYPDWDRYGRVR